MLRADTRVRAKTNGMPRRVSTFGTSKPETAYIAVIASIHSPLCLSSFGSTLGPRSGQNGHVHAKRGPKKPVTGLHADLSQVPGREHRGHIPDPVCVGHHLLDLE